MPLTRPRTRIGLLVMDMFLPLHLDRKSTRLNSSHSQISYAVFCLKKKKNKRNRRIAASPSAAEHGTTPHYGHLDACICYQVYVVLHETHLAERVSDIHSHRHYRV